MTDYQMNVTIDTYFEILIEEGISEKNVEDMYQKDGTLHIVLKGEEKKIIKRKIKNFDN